MASSREGTGLCPLTWLGLKPLVSGPGTGRAPQCRCQGEEQGPSRGKAGSPETTHAGCSSLMGLPQLVTESPLLLSWGPHPALLKLPPTFRVRTPTGVHRCACLGVCTSTRQPPTVAQTQRRVVSRSPPTPGTERTTKSRRLCSPLAFLGFTEEAASPLLVPRTCQKHSEFCLLPPAEP